MVNNFLLDGVRGVAREVPQPPTVPIPEVVVVEGIVSINGLTAQSQSIIIDTSLTFPQINSVGAVHTISIPYASVSGVNGGIIGHSDYLNWNSKEPGLGLPSSTGYILSSTALGVRSWVDPSTLTPSTVPWSHITSTPTTVAGYGITDVYTKTAGDARYLQTVTLTGDVTGSGSASFATTVTWANGYTTYDTRYLQLSGGTITAPILYAGSPSGANELINKSYVDNLITGITWKSEVACATTANITLSGEQTIDGVTTSASRVLVKNQTTQTQNGIYVTSSGAWTRSLDADSGTEIAQATALVGQGSTYANTQWTCTNATVTIGTTNITFGQIAGAGVYTNGIGILLTGNVFSIDNTYVASGSQTGYLSAANWTTFNSKQNALTFGNLTETTSSVLTLTGNTGAIIGSGLTIQVKQSNTSTAGYISSTDWNTFNNKQAAISATNGSVLFYNSGVTQDNSNFYFASHLLSVTTGGDLAGTDSINVYNQMDAFAPNSANTVGTATSAGYTVSSARGTTGSFTESTDGDYIGSFAYWPANGANSWTEGISLRGYVSGSTSTNRGTRFELWTKKDSGVTTKAFTVDNLQNMTFASTTANGLVANNLTTTQKNALTGIAGAMVYDTVQTRQSFYNNGAWVNFLKLSGDTMTGSLNMGTNSITGVTSLVLGTNDQIADVSGIGIAFGYNNNQSLSNAAFRNNKFTVTINAGSESSLGFTSADGGLAVLNSSFSYSVSSSTGTLTAGQNYLGSITLTNGGGTVTVTDWAGFRITRASVAASQTLTNLHGLRFEDQTSSGITNVYAVRSLLVAATNRWNLYLDGTAQSYLNGNVGIKIAVPQVELDVSGTIQATGNIKNVTVGGGFFIKEGTNGTMGVVNLTAGTATVSTTKVTANSRIYLTVQVLGTIVVPVPIAVTARSAGTSFTVTSSAATDTSTVAWVILEPS